jgi:hypothetical protein
MKMTRSTQKMIVLCSFVAIVTFILYPVFQGHFVNNRNDMLAKPSSSLPIMKVADDTTSASGLGEQEVEEK